MSEHHPHAGADAYPLDFGLRREHAVRLRPGYVHFTHKNGYRRQQIHVGSGPEADNSAAAGKPARDVNAIARAADPPNLRKRHLRRLAISK